MPVQTTHSVTGMTCGHCARAGDGPLPLGEVRSAVAEAGYRPAGYRPAGYGLAGYGLAGYGLAGSDG
jgi:copper chaperone CopZ